MRQLTWRYSGCLTDTCQETTSTVGTALDEPNRRHNVQQETASQSPPLPMRGHRNRAACVRGDQRRWKENEWDGEEAKRQRTRCVGYDNECQSHDKTSLHMQTNPSAPIQLCEPTKTKDKRTAKQTKEQQRDSCPRWTFRKHARNYTHTHTSLETNGRGDRYVSYMSDKRYKTETGFISTITRESTKASTDTKHQTKTERRNKNKWIHRRRRK